VTQVGGLTRTSTNSSLAWRSKKEKSFFYLLTQEDFFLRTLQSSDSGEVVEKSKASYVEETFHEHARLAFQLVARASASKHQQRAKKFSFVSLARFFAYPQISLGAVHSLSPLLKLFLCRHLHLSKRKSSGSERTKKNKLK
jgi:hypothetical protein